MKSIIIAPILALLLIIFSASLIAEEECIFDEAAYIHFINKYKANNLNAIIEKATNALTLKRDGETIVVNGGGCIHLGMSIKVHSEKTYSEKEFLQKTLTLSSEFGNWLINTRALKESITKKQFQKINNIYFIKMDAMTIFEASFDKGEINISFYIN